MTFTHGFADNNGLRTYYEVHGREVPGRPPLLLIPGARLLIVPGGHGDYLGEQAASGGDLRTMHATVPFLLRFLDA
ncbi:hypothetical protein [Arthrobacter sp. ISL-69]|uniref:hypothetical protein n=1 Tax=Arthrobacter sp. ISL-69 TaxID=2819113 RepID=UPI002035511D|nr:hypothetical protein [Arthrobacter sp. ISL-69]